MMNMPVILSIAIRYIWGRSIKQLSFFIFWMSVILISIGVMSLIVVSSVMNGFENELEEKIIKFIPQVLITNSKKQINSKNFPISLLNSVKNCTNISPLIISNVILNTANNLSIGVMLGINPDYFEPLKFYLIDTSIDQLISGQYRVILGKQLAEQLRVQKGDTIRLIIPDTSNYFLALPIFRQRLFEVIGIYNVHSEVNSYQLIINQQDAARLMHYPDGYITGWRLFLKKPLEIYNIGDKISLPDGLIWEDWRIYKGDIFQSMCLEKMLMNLLLSLIVTVAIFNLVTSLSVLAIKKQTDIVILQMQGLRLYQIILIFVIYGISIPILGVVFGTILGVILISKLDLILFNFFNTSALSCILHIPSCIKPVQIVFIIISSIVLSLIVILFVILYIFYITPTKILCHVK